MWIDKYVDVQLIPDVRVTFGKNFSHARNGFGLAVKGTPDLLALRGTVIAMLEHTIEHYDEPAPVHSAATWNLNALVTQTYSDIERRHLYDANLDRIWRASTGPLFMHDLRFRMCGGVVTEYQAVAILRLVRENWLLSGGHPIAQPSPTKQNVVHLTPIGRALKQPQHMPNGLFVPNA